MALVAALNQKNDLIMKIPFDQPPEVLLAKPATFSRRSAIRTPVSQAVWV